jgi:prepilin-type N-terminal cleavage/methylation domain-containing protein
MKKNYNRGFTLIELLVVIAIIGILASVVLASLNTARQKGADAAVKASLANARAQAELYYDGNIGTASDSDSSASTTGYAGVCLNATNGVANILNGSIKQALDANGAYTTGTPVLTAGSENGTCNDSTTAWAAEFPMKGGSLYCVDSAGKSQVNSAAGTSASDYAC